MTSCLRGKLCHVGRPRHRSCPCGIAGIGKAIAEVYGRAKRVPHLSACRSWWGDVERAPRTRVESRNDKVKFDPPLVLVPDPDDTAPVRRQAGKGRVLDPIHDV